MHKSNKLAKSVSYLTPNTVYATTAIIIIDFY